MEVKEKNKNMRNSKGITLVALVVTIIVLIILAGVSINLVLGDNGIIIKVHEARQAQEIAEIKENLQMEILTKELQIEEAITQSKIEEIIKAKYGEASVIKNADGTIKCVKPEGKEYEIPFEDIYSGTLEKTERLLSDLKVGDYIKYDTGVTSVGKNGVIMCRVLYNDETNGLQIISDKNVANIELGGNDWETGKVAYNNVITDLNNESEKYLNTAYAVDARCVGSIPTVDANNNFTQKDSGTQTTVSIHSSWTLPSGWTTTDTGCYDSDENYITDRTALRAANIWIIGEDYWLASRNVQSNASYASNCYFYVYGGDEKGALEVRYFCCVSPDGSIKGKLNNCGLRPCFSLRSDINITGGDGTSEDTAYIMYK